MVAPVEPAVRAATPVWGRTSPLVVRVVVPVPVVPVAVARRTARSAMTVVLAVMVARLASRVPVA